MPTEDNECSCNVIHREAVAKAKKYMPSEELIRDIGDFFKVFGEPTRIMILNALFHSEMCVCDLAALLDMNQPAVSHQLKILRQARLVTYRKDGKVVYYSLNDDHVKQIYEQGMNHIKEQHGAKK